MEPQQDLLDIGYAIESPEGVTLQVDTAGPFVRFIAFSIDLSIRLGLFIAIAIVSALLGITMGSALVLLAIFLIEWFYPLLFEVFRAGQTPGKKSMGIVVVNDDLTPVTMSGAFIRNLLRAADFLPMFYTFGLITMAMNRNFQRLGDIAAGTIVIYKKGISEKQAVPSLKPAPPSIDLNEQDQRALVEYTLRHEKISDARQIELAEILKDTLPAPSVKDGKALSEHIKSIGVWLLGAR